MKKVSLIQQLWALVLAAVLLAATGSLLANLYNARDYMQQQLTAHGKDAANSLALMITQGKAEQAMGETLINAAFDQGHFRSIRWLGADGQVKVQRQNPQQFGDTPAWFRQAFALDASPGRAMINSGWLQAGVIEVESDAGYAYAALWRGAMQIFTWVGLAGLLVGLVASLGVNAIRRQLHSVVDQAKAITQRRFVTIPEPGGPEMGRLAQAMNAMVGRIKAMFEEEAQRLEQLRRQLNFDAVTGLANRGYFMGLLQAELEAREAREQGLLLLRVQELTEFNNALGRALTDQLLQKLAAGLSDRQLLGEQILAARLNGSDFAVLFDAELADEAGLTELHQRLSAELASFAGRQVLLAMALTDVREGDSIRDLMSRLDHALAVAEAAGCQQPEIAKNHAARQTLQTTDAWAGFLDQAVARRELKLVSFAVRGRAGEMLHEEAPLRLQQGEAWLPAGQFMPMAIRTGRVAALDLAAVSLALQRLAAEPACPGIAVNLAAESLQQADYVTRLAQLVRQYKVEAGRLWLEVAEAGIVNRFEAFRELCLALADLPCRVGIEHFGRQFSLVGQLHDLGIDYLKIDASFIQDIQQQDGQQALLKGLCQIAHNIGLGVIAEGVHHEAEQQMLFSLGFDGVTGPGVR